MPRSKEPISGANARIAAIWPDLEEAASPEQGPEAGDIVIEHDAISAGYFSIRQLPGGAQMSCGSYDGAVAAVRGFARRHGVDLWVREATSAPRLVERGRRNGHQTS